MLHNFDHIPRFNLNRYEAPPKMHHLQVLYFPCGTQSSSTSLQGPPPPKFVSTPQRGNETAPPLEEFYER